MTEVLIISPDVRKLIKENVDADTLLRQALKSGFKVMQQDAVAKVLEGVTTLQEITRVIMVDQTPSAAGGLQEAAVEAPLITSVFPETVPGEPLGRTEPLPRFQNDFTEFFSAVAGEIAGFVAGVVFDKRGKVLAYSSFLSTLPLEDSDLLAQFLNAAGSLPECGEVLLTTPKFFLYFQNNNQSGQPANVLLVCDRHTSNLSSIRAEVERAYRYFPADIIDE